MNITISGAVYAKGKEEDMSNALRYGASGTAYINFRIGAYGGKDKDKIYISCVAFNELAEHIAGSCKNGTRLLVTGRMESNNWEKDDGTKMYDNQILVDDAGLDLRFGVGQMFDTERSEGQPRGNWGNTVSAPKARDTYNPDEAPF